jgi:hypothetical protein
MIHHWHINSGFTAAKPDPLASNHPAQAMENIYRYMTIITPTQKLH